MYYLRGIGALWASWKGKGFRVDFEISVQGKSMARGFRFKVTLNPKP